MTRFTLRNFLRDRQPYILVYTAFAVLTVTIVQLDLWLSGASLQFANLFYILTLGLVGRVLFLVIDYRRQKPFFEQLGRDASPGALDELSFLEHPITLEQRLYAEAWADLFARLNRELSEERQRTARRLQFLSQWAHHMKTPVSVIDLELQKARRQAWPGSEQFIDSVSEENERVRASLQALLNMLRLDHFASDFRVEPVDLLQLARQVVNDFRHAFIAHRVYPKVEEPDLAAAEPLLTPLSDAKWLRLVLEQIISNAIKYSALGEGDGQVVIRFFFEDGKTVMEVADNGIGIPPEDLGRIFEPFFTGTAGRKQPTSTGLGLYLAKEACDRLGHTLTVRSAPGEGTRVRIGFSPDSSIFAPLKKDLTIK